MLYTPRPLSAPLRLTFCQRKSVTNLPCPIGGWHGTREGRADGRRVVRHSHRASPQGVLYLGRSGRTIYVVLTIVSTVSASAVGSAAPSRAGHEALGFVEAILEGHCSNAEGLGPASHVLVGASGFQHVSSQVPMTFTRACTALLTVLLIAPIAPAQSREPDTISVSPFANISGAPEDAWIGAGIAETVTADLTSASGIPVVRSPSRDVETGVRWVVTGGYQRLGSQLRITARVIEVSTNLIVHSAQVDGDVSELFALQDRLGAALRAGLPGGTPNAASPPPAPPAPAGPAPPATAAAVSAPVARGGFSAVPGLIDGHTCTTEEESRRVMT